MINIVNMTSETEVSVDSRNISVLSSETSSSSSKESSGDVTQRSAFRAMIFFQVFAYGSYSVLVHLCERDGAIMFSSTTMNLVLELIKLTFSFVALFYSSAKTFHLIRMKGSWLRHSLPYSIPGLLYFINNNLAVHMQLQMDPASYQILSNFKIATTAILYRLIMKQKLSRRQWFAVTLLLFGGFFYSLGAIKTSVLNSQDGMNRMYIRPLGIPMIFVYCTLSGLAGVFNEWILKKHYSTSLHLQNIYLYTYGFLLNLVPAIGIPLLASQSLHWINPFAGFSIYTWLIVSTQAANGIFMSVLIKHTSNIIRLFVISFSLIVTILLSLVVFHLTLNAYFFISFGTMMCALWLYYAN